MIIVLLRPVPWSPPGVDLESWRRALAEDVVDLLATLSEVEPAIAATAADRALADAVAWPSMRVYDLPEPTVNAALAAAAADGFEQAAVIAPDVPDVPGLVLGKLLRPLTTRPVAVAPAEREAGLLGVACPAAGAGLAAGDRPRRRRSGDRAQGRSPAQRRGRYARLAAPEGPCGPGYARSRGGGLGRHPPPPHRRPLTGPAAAAPTTGVPHTCHPPDLADLGLVAAICPIWKAISPRSARGAGRCVAQRATVAQCRAVGGVRPAGRSVTDAQGGVTAGGA